MHTATAETPARPHFGIVAVILLRLDARPTEWVTVVDLAIHLGCAPDTVRRELEQLSAKGLVSVDRFRAEDPHAIDFDLVGEIRQARANPCSAH